MSAPENGVKRTVTFTPWCRRCPGWRPDPQDQRGIAAFILATHNMDVHGGTPRGEDET